MKKIHFDRPCEKCGKSYKPRYAEQRFCSMACRPKTSGRPRVLGDRECEACGKTFRPADRFKRYCSRKCRPGKPVTHFPACATCGESFRPRYYNAKYCSDACIPSRKSTVGKGRYSHITLICENCGRAFHPWKLDRKSRFCSRACAPKGRQPTRPAVTCEMCGVIFAPTAQFQRFCGRKCYIASNPKIVTPHGYIIVYAPKYSDRENGQMLEHRAVMAEKLGRKLGPHETVHHINGDRSDNRLENLQLRSGQHGKGAVRVCLDCGSSNIQHAPIAD